MVNIDFQLIVRLIILFIVYVTSFHSFFFHYGPQVTHVKTYVSPFRVPVSL